MKRKIFINAVSSLIQVIIVTLVYIVLYKYLFDKIGVEQLGIWSLVLASSSILNISNLGFSSGVIKYVAKYAALNDNQKIVDIIQTSLITVGITSGITILLVLPFAGLVLKLIVPADYLTLSLSILPYSLISLWITIISQIFTSTLDGFQRFDLKNIIVITGVVLYLGFTVILVPEYKLFGVVYAQIFQSLSILLFSLILVKKTFAEYSPFLLRWRKETFKEMFNYSIKLQGMSVIQLLYDPVTKGLLTKFGGLAATGYYEMANRLIQRVRSFVLAANQVLVPAFASIVEESEEKFKNLYAASINYAIYLAIPIFLFMITAAPLISVIWIGSYETYFVSFLIILSVAWSLNIISAPAYFANLGTGDLNWNLISHIVIGILNLMLGIIMGYSGGPLFVIYAWGISVVIGSLLIPVSFHLRTGISVLKLFSKENIILLIVNIVASVSSLAVYTYLSTSINIVYLSLLVFLTYILISGYFIWNHSVRMNFVNIIKGVFRTDS